MQTKLSCQDLGLRPPWRIQTSTTTQVTGPATGGTKTRSADVSCRRTNGRRNGAELALPLAQSPKKTSANKTGRHSPLRYYGGKANTARKIVELFAPHICFVDVFGGAANILLVKPPGSGVEVLNDVDQLSFLKTLSEWDRAGEVRHIRA